MSFVLDENLSPALVSRLASVYPGCCHVREVGLSRSDDLAVWNYAIEKQLAIVSKDSDYHQMSFVYGPPPKVIWVRLGNCSTEQVDEILKLREVEIRRFLDDPGGALLVLGRE